MLMQLYPDSNKSNVNTVIMLGEIKPECYLKSGCMKMFLRAGEMGVKKSDRRTVWGEWALKKRRDLPERTTAESKERGCEGDRRNEGVRRVCGRGKGEKGRKLGWTEDQRSSVSGMEAISERWARTRSMARFSARRHSFTLRKARTWARAGKTCTQGEPDTERKADRGKAGREAGHFQRERDSYRGCFRIHSNRHAQKGNEINTAAGFIRKSHVNKSVHSRDTLKRNKTNKQFWFFKNWLHMESGVALLFKVFLWFV